MEGRKALNCILQCSIDDIVEAQVMRHVPSKLVGVFTVSQLTWYEIFIVFRNNQNNLRFILVLTS
jgi:hypothetical protein